jgi:putative FmdB family regulatory protein
MPIYDYMCTACDHRTDILHGINDPGPHFCPSCGKAGTMRKQFAAPTIHFKGSGWAKKDRGGSGAGTKAASRGDSSKATDAHAAASPSSDSGSGSSSDSGSASSSDSGSGSSSSSGPTTD